MSDHDPGTHMSGESGGTVKYVLLGIAGLYVLLSLYLMFDMRGRIATLEEKQGATTAAQQELKSHF